jgi:hypothetical protein
MPENSKETVKPDFIVANHGSVAVLTPLTSEASDWLSANVSFEPWQLWGGGIALDSRFVDDLVTGIEEEGLTLQ